MAIGRAETGVADGYAALAAGEWDAVRAAFEASLEHGDDPDALDGLGRALWWLRDGEGAVVHRERAYAGFRREGQLARAARIALWLSREYGLVWGKEAAARGWLARAERLLADVAPGAEQGWLDLARAERTRELDESARLAAGALETALRAGDVDLELRALAQLGLAEVSLGDVEKGLARLDEAMAAATSGEPATLETFADVCCSLLLACELAGDRERSKQWGEVFETFVRQYDHVPLLAFCRSCCADVYQANGRVAEAELELLTAMRELSEAGQRSRCSQPAAKLAELRVLQGRFDEAEQLLAGFDDAPEAVEAAVTLRLARDEPLAAADLLEWRLDEVGRASLLAAPLLAQLVEARLAVGDVPAAVGAAEAVERIAERSGSERIAALASLARGRVAARVDPVDAALPLADAVRLLARAALPLHAARARLELARLVAASTAERAIELARRARTELEVLGATREADAAAAFLRTLGAKGPAGPRSHGSLSRRELEVLRLLGEGLANGEIARRLFISPKTAEHHVSRIYAKLGLRGRAEAAAYAARNRGGE